MSSEASGGSPELEKRGSSPWLMLAIVLVGLVGLFVFVALVMAALLLPALNVAREAARRSNCVNNLRTIGIALQNYHDTYKSFPPAYVADDAGRVMHSWRIFLLPFLDDPQATAIYELYDFDEPWDGPHNRALAERVPRVFQCPAGEAAPGETHYLAVVGQETMWPPGAATALHNISDKTAWTVAVVETTGSGVAWLEPRDLSVPDALQGVRRETGGGLNSHHPGGVNVLMCDASVHFLDEQTERKHVHALLTIDGGEPVDGHTLGE